jgi:hypothetical protein
MPITLVNPLNEMAPVATPAPARLDTLAGKTVGLLDISKAGGSFFLDRLEELLKERYGVAEVLRVTKPTFAKPAPQAILDQLRSVHAVVEGLAD